MNRTVAAPQAHRPPQQHPEALNAKARPLCDQRPGGPEPHHRINSRKARHMQLTGTILAEQPAATARPTHLRVVPPPPPPVNLGPSAADTPDHPGWCAIHDTDLGDGTSLCIGEPVALTCGTRGAEGERVGAGLTASTGEPAHLNLTVDGAQRAALTVASAREYAALLTHLADQADTAAALR